MTSAAVEGAGPVVARPAATIVLARDGFDGLEVLVLRRSAGSRFAPGFLVFPGGVVEDGDRDLAVRWFGDPAELDRACAVRELEEETGLLLDEGGVARAAQAAEPPAHLDPSDLPEIAHWLAPDFLPVRFDARFFAARGGPDGQPRTDGVEIEAAWWARPRDVLEDHGHGGAALMWPTLKMLEALARCATVDEVLALRVAQVAPPVAPPSSAMTT